MVEEGGDKAIEEGEREAVEAKPPPKIPLLQWHSKALGPSFAAARKATVVPWFAQALQERCARNQSLYAGATHTHMTMEWVFRR